MSTTEDKLVTATVILMACVSILAGLLGGWRWGVGTFAALLAVISAVALHDYLGKMRR